ncbi:hypothetical protein Tco_0429757 [Tanacetum coccineum]
MSSITAQQTKLDLELVPKEKRLDIGKCNGRLNPGKIQREPTFQVVLDALALTPCYSAFLITADVPEVYMHQFWDSVYKHDTFYRFKIDKRKRFKLNLEVFRDIFKICPRVQGQDFDALPTDEEIVSFLRDLGHTREIHSLNDVVVDQMHQPWRTFAALINRSLSGKTTGLDKLRLSRAQILWGMYHQKNVDYVELLWEDFIYQIDNKAYKKQEKMYYPRFTKVIIHHFLTQDKTLSWRNKIGMHTSKDDYLINTLRFVSAKEETQIYGVILPDSLTSPEMKETKAYKTYLVSTEEPTGKSKRVKRHAKKTIGVITKASTREVRRKSMRDFHKTHPSGSGAVKIIPLVTSEGTGGNDEDDSNNEQESSGEDSDRKNDIDDDKTQSDNENESNSEHETHENESGSESDQDKNEEDEDDDDEEEVKDELVKTSSNDSNDEDKTKITNKAEGDEDEEIDYTTSQLSYDLGINGYIEPRLILIKGLFKRRSGSESDQDKNKDDEDDEEEVKDELVKTSSNDSNDKDKTKITNKAEGDEDEEMDYTTSQLYDDVDIRLNEPVDSDKGFVQEEGTDAAMTNIQQGNENSEILQVIEDAHVTLSTVPQKTEVPVTSSSHSSDLADKFLNFSDIPHTDAEIVSPMDVHVYHEVPSQQTPTLLTVPGSVIFDSSQAAATLTKFELKKILIDKMDKSESYLVAPKHRECCEGLKKSYDLDKTIFSTYGPEAKELQSGSSKGDKSQSKSSGKSVQSEEPEFEVADSDMLQDQEENLGKDDKEPKEKVASKGDWFTKPTQPQEPTDPD